MNCRSEIYYEIFYDSKIATVIHCKKTKSLEKIHNKFAKLSVHHHYNQSHYFSVAADDSTLFGKSIYPIIISYYDFTYGHFDVLLTCQVARKNL